MFSKDEIVGAIIEYQLPEKIAYLFNKNKKTAYELWPLLTQGINVIFNMQLIPDLIQFIADNY